MIEQLKKDRLAQAIVVGTILIACFTCSVFGTIAYLKLGRISSTTGPVAQQPLPTQTGSSQLSIAPPTENPNLTATPPVDNTLPSTPTNTRVVPPTDSSTVAPDTAPRSSPQSGSQGMAEKLAPGGPTATPPGEDITDPNYVQGKAAYQAEAYQEVLRLMTIPWLYGGLRRASQAIPGTGCVPRSS